MTRDDFFALPIAKSIDREMRIVDGKQVEFPVFRNIGVAWVEPDEPVGFRDDEGVGWMIVTMDGKRARERVSW